MRKPCANKTPPICLNQFSHEVFTLNKVALSSTVCLQLNWTVICHRDKMLLRGMSVQRGSKNIGSQLRSQSLKHPNPQLSFTADIWKCKTIKDQFTYWATNAQALGYLAATCGFFGMCIITFQMPQKKSQCWLIQQKSHMCEGPILII